MLSDYEKYVVDQVAFNILTCSNRLRVLCDAHNDINAKELATMLNTIAQLDDIHTSLIKDVRDANSTDIRKKY